MEEFLYWGEVQQKLSNHLAETGSLYSFYDAVWELYEGGAAKQAEELPKVSFDEWETDDLEQFDQIYNQVPVDLSRFYLGFQRNCSATKAIEHSYSMDISVMRLAHDQANGIHCHDLFEIDYVMRGTATVELNGLSCTLEQGKFCFISPGLMHDIVPEKGAQVISITIPVITAANTLNRLLSRDSILSDFFYSMMNNGTIGYLIVKVSDDRNFRMIIRKMFHEHFCRLEYEKMIAPDYLAILLADVLRQCGEHYERHSETNWKSDVPILSILKYMQANYRSLTLGQLAEQFHYEPSHLGKLIKASIGKSYTDAVRELRLIEAKKLLRETGLSMEKVAEQSGFNNQVHFFRVFRQTFGCTPGEYRKKRTEE